MLSKLLKHEIKATARLLLPLYLVLVVLTIMDRIALGFDFQSALAIIPGFITFAYIISLIAIAVVSFVIIILRFYRNLMTDEGYLMFTLPVKSTQLINSKLIVAFVLTVASLVIIILSLLGVLATPDRMYLLREGMNTFLMEMRTEFGLANTTLVLVEFAFLLVFGMLNGILMIYASIAIGQLFHGHRVLGSFAAYIGISTLLQIIVSVGMVILGFLFNKSFEDISAIPQIIFPLTIVYTIVTTCLFYWMTNLIFKKKLNLE